MAKIGTRTLLRRVQDLERQLSLAMQLGQVTLNLTDPTTGKDETKQVSWAQLYKIMKTAAPAHAKANAVQATPVIEPIAPEPTA